MHQLYCEIPQLIEKQRSFILWASCPNHKSCKFNKIQIMTHFDQIITPHYCITNPNDLNYEFDMLRKNPSLAASALIIKRSTQAWLQASRFPANHLRFLFAGFHFLSVNWNFVLTCKCECQVERGCCHLPHHGALWFPLCCKNNNKKKKRQFSERFCLTDCLSR